MDKAPQFYHEITDLAAATLQGMWSELHATSDALAAALGLEEPPSPLRRIMSALMERYGAVVSDSSTLLSGFRTNAAYAGFTHAVRRRRRPRGRARAAHRTGWPATRQCGAAASAARSAPLRVQLLTPGAAPLPPLPLPRCAADEGRPRRQRQAGAQLEHPLLV